MSLRLIGLLLIPFVGLAHLRAAEPPSARVIKFHNYDQAIELRNGGVRAVVSPQAGGRVLEFSVDGKQALYLDEKEKEWQPGTTKPTISAGRFDYGPELTVAPHPTIWSGDWNGEITGECKAKLTSPRDEAAGVQLEREFTLFGFYYLEVPGKHYYELHCRQTIVNIGDKPLEVCHWGRSFSPGGGIALVPLTDYRRPAVYPGGKKVDGANVPLADRPSRFPSKYAMYEDSAILNVRNTDDKIRERDGFLEILGPPRKPKLGFDSYAGWLGYLMPNDTLFVKRFETDPDRVYNEAAGLTLSIWYPEGPRIELEPIGPRERLKPGGRATFTEKWSLHPFPFPKNGESADLNQLRENIAKDWGRSR